VRDDRDWNGQIERNLDPQNIALAALQGRRLAPPAASYNGSTCSDC
jgi:hypothetical protein